MANEHKIEIHTRKEINKQSLKQVRRDGNIPGVYYSFTSKTSMPFYISKNEYSQAIKSGARIFNISVGGKKQNVLFKSVQYNPVTENVIHVDLYGVRMDVAVSIKVQVQLIGDPIGVKEEGGVLNQASNEIEIQCLPGDIPEFVEMDISHLGLGDAVNVGSIELDENKFTLITNKDTVLASVTHAMKEIEPVVEPGDDDEFLDEDGEPIEGDDGKETEKPTDDGDGNADTSNKETDSN